MTDQTPNQNQPKEKPDKKEVFMLILPQPIKLHGKDYIAAFVGEKSSFPCVDDELVFKNLRITLKEQKICRIITGSS